MDLVHNLVGRLSSFFSPEQPAALPAPAAAPVADDQLSGVELCRVPAFGMGQPIYQGLKRLGVDASHQWLRGPGFESGMGPDPDSHNPLKVAWRDHAARSVKEQALGNRVCTPVEREDPALAGVQPEDVARNSRPGRKIDPWYKLVKDNCQTTARGALNQAALERRSRCDPTDGPAPPMMSMAPEPEVLQSLFGGYT